MIHKPKDDDGDRSHHKDIDAVTDIIMASMVQTAQEMDLCLPCTSIDLGAKCLAAVLVNNDGIDRKTGAMNPQVFGELTQHFLDQVMSEARLLIEQLQVTKH